MIFPDFFVPEEGKTQKWCEDILRAICTYSDTNSMFQSERRKMSENYGMVGGTMRRDQFEYVTQPGGQVAPARLVDYKFCQPPIEALVGEFLGQPLSFDTTIIDKNGNVEKLEKKLKAYAEVLTKSYRKDIEDMMGMELSDEEVAAQIEIENEDIEDLNYRENLEDVVYHGLKYLISKYNLKDVFKLGLYDLCIASREFYWLDIVNGDPVAEWVHPSEVIYDVNTDKEFVEDSQFAAREKWMSHNEIITKYGNQLKPEQLSKIKEMANGDVSGGNHSISDRFVLKETGMGSKIRVIHGVWASEKSMRVKVNENPYDPDEPFFKLLPETYKPSAKERIETRPFVDVWEGIMIGEEIFVKCRRKPNQFRREQWGYANTKLNLVGAVKGNHNGINVSIVDAIKNLALLYNQTMFHIELTMNRSAGKAVVYDMALKPKNFSFSDVIGHAKNSGIIAINTVQEGYRATSFNQFQQIDFSMSQQITQLLNLKMMLEQTRDKLTGVTEARQGITKSSDKVGVNQSSIFQSTLMTQSLFYLHSRVIEQVLNRLADLMRYAWKKGDKLNYFMDYKRVKFFEITEDMDNSDIGVFMENTSRQQQRKDELKGFAAQALSSGQIDWDTMLDVIYAETANEARSIFKSGMQAISEQKQQIQAQMAEAEKAKAEAEKMKLENPLKVADLQGKYDIEVAHIQNDAQDNRESMKIEAQQDMLTAKGKQNLDHELFKNAGLGADDETASAPKK